MPQTQDKIMQTGQVVSTLVQVVLTQYFKCKAKRSGSVDTSSCGVDTRDSSQNTFWPIWDSVSTLAQVVMKNPWSQMGLGKSDEHPS
ncbi:hypothetical protein Taro_012040 [Colocasia esculenta]|uniref:Uncharacterized protein n=1 Tax=Colocasia esculenta TaxID=4460 RepID=A0A843UCL0_COLES|nr:hypothetical protein [Colocasia esculenta]